MSHPTATVFSRFFCDDFGRVDVYADGKFLFVAYDGHTNRFRPEEAKLLVEAITARLAEVTEGQCS